MYYYYKINIGGGEFIRTIPQEYEPIHIKWSDGFMDICPPGIFEIGDTRTCLTNFRKVVKLSAESDLTKGTNTISAWRKALKAEFDFQYRVNTVISDEYRAEYTRIVDNAAQPDKKRANKLKQLHKRKNNEIKRLDARKKRVQKCAAILEEIAEKYQ